MADFTPVASQVNPPATQNPIQTLSGILGIQQQKQELQKQAQAIQTGQYLQQTAQGEAQGAQQAMGERQTLQSVLKSGVRPDMARAFITTKTRLIPTSWRITPPRIFR